MLEESFLYTFFGKSNSDGKGGVVESIVNIIVAMTTTRY